MSITTRLLTPDDARLFCDFCDRHPDRALPLKLHIDTFGLGSSEVHTCGAFAGGALQGLLLRLGNIALVVDSGGECAEALAGDVDQQIGLAGIRGTAETVQAVSEKLKRYRPTDWEDSPFMTLRTAPVCSDQTSTRARRALPEDLDGLVSLYSHAGSMYRSRANVSQKLETGRVFIVASGGWVVSCALLNVEGSEAGLIGGVYTSPSARGKGHAAACTAALSADLLRTGKIACLFYENPTAGRVYRRLGFKQVDLWALLYLAPYYASPRT